jgi:hypothetical protein
MKKTWPASSPAMNLYKRLGFEERQPPAEEKLSDDICYLAISISFAFGPNCENTDG